jgi:hypothetical protein
MRSTLSRVTFTLIVTYALMISSLTEAKAQSPRWLDFGETSNGEKLQLDASSVKLETMAIDDTINMEGLDNDDVKGIPMHSVVAFKYNIGGRDRMAYTISCNGRSLMNNPEWRTFTRHIDYWPQYFSVSADSNSSIKMLKKVCKLSS